MWLIPSLPSPQPAGPIDLFSEKSPCLSWPLLCAPPSEKSHPDYCASFVAGHAGFIQLINIDMDIFSFLVYLHHGTHVIRCLY